MTYFDKETENAYNIARSLYSKGEYSFSMSIIVLESTLVWEPRFRIYLIADKMTLSSPRKGGILLKAEGVF